MPTDDGPHLRYLSSRRRRRRVDARPLRPEALLVELGVVVALWALVVGTIAAFDRVGRRAAALLVPYLLWVGFAAVLNYQFWRLN